MLAPEMMVKQYITDITLARGRFRVFETGDPKFLLFAPLDRYGCDTCQHFPVAKNRLKPEVKRLIYGKPPKK